MSHHGARRLAERRKTLSDGFRDHLAQLKGRSFFSFIFKFEVNFKFQLAREIANGKRVTFERFCEIWPNLGLTSKN